LFLITCNCSSIISHSSLFCCFLSETRSQLHKHRAVTDDFEELDIGKIKRQAPLLTEDDARYAGRRVSRKDIEEHITATGSLFTIK